MRVLIVTRLYPNARDPSFSPFNRQQFAALARRCDVSVVASIPWFPGARLFARWSAAGRLVGVPREERIDGLPVVHPRYLYVPRVHGAAGALYAASLAREVLRRRGRHDVVLGSWAFPDGVGAVALARLLGVPAVIKVHGSDMNVLARTPAIARNLRWALPRARRVVAVSRPLGDVVASFGVPRDRIDVVPNGVDAELFRPRDRAAARAELGHAGDARRWLLYVGRLREDKGVLDLLEAFGRLAERRADVRLALVGDGEARAACERAAGRLGDRVLVAGQRPLEEVPRWMAACDALVLPSWAEGTPNVVLEALACGRRAVATRVGGTPDLIVAPELGELVPPREPALLADALARAADTPYDPAAVARAGARGGWSESAAHLEGSLRAALA
ncbi:MAG TPA: glycosyltransferase family 4 protein [Haliangiales bacterium]|nr:glycosyltransferase family 4 protein [Haliangiales bacterium]